MGTETPPAEKQVWLTRNAKLEEPSVEYSEKYNGTIHFSFSNKSWWSRRSQTEKRLVFLFLLCLCLAIGLAIALAVVSTNDDTDERDSQTGANNVCTSIACVLAAAQVAQSIDFSVDPCDDFYQYACGAWMTKHVIPEDRSDITTFSVLRDEVDVILKNLLEDNETYSNQDVMKKTKQLYASCMNLDMLEDLSDGPLRAFLYNLGGWPMVDPEWNNAAFNLTDILKELQLYNNKPLLNLYVSTDMKNSSARILMLDQPGFGLPGRGYYLTERNNSFIKAYETLMKNIALQLGASTSTVDRDVQDVVDFEIQLANISVPDEDRRDSEALYNLYTLPQLERNFSGPIDWQGLLKAVFSHQDINLALADDEPIVNRSPLYFTRLISLLRGTTNRTLANFLIWRITMNRATALSETYRGFFNDFNKVVSGTMSASARHQSCAQYTTQILPLSVGHMFVKEAFDEEAKDLALDMIMELKKAFNQLLNELEWMDDATKTVAREKNEFIDEKIGYPDQVLNLTYLTELYEKYTYDEKTYFDNVVINTEQSARRNLLDLRTPVDKELWSTAPSTVNAFYSSQQNQIMFPAGILQPPFFSKTYPKSLNYGAIGVVIGHEITHGFDDRGRQYDKEGNLKQWWSDEAIEKFKTRAECIINQYGNYTLVEADMNVNGINTQGENIADNGGLKQSFRAYRNWVKEERNGQEEKLLPGLQFTNDQLFFVNFAQIWCSNMRKESAIQRILTGVHSPGQFRVIGTLQNSRDFAQAFNCPLGKSYMNPEKKCEVW